MQVEAEVFVPAAAPPQSASSAGAAPLAAQRAPAAAKAPPAAAAGPKAPPVAAGRVQADGRFSALRALTAGSRTNENMLLFRTLNRDMGMPNANGDFLAPLLRDRLMPLRSKWLAVAPGARPALLRGLEHPRLGTPGVCNFVDARTKWLDGVVQSALDAGIDQVVAVAAGFDTRAYRFGAEAAARGQTVAFFEVDLPEASSKKRALAAELLSAYPSPAFVAADLASTPLMEALETHGAPAGGDGPPKFDRSKPALFTVEGLVYYLPEPAVCRLLGGVAARAAPGSRVAFDFLADDALEGRAEYPAYKVTARSVANKGEPFVFGLPSSSAGVQAFFDGPVARASAAALGSRAAAAVGKTLAAGAGEQQLLEVTAFFDAKEMAARQLPHLQWPDAAPAGGGSRGPAPPPPMLLFYSFVEAEVALA